ncbi:MAG TPA: beta-N-acetylhexosaminidase [Fimbriimonadaceae bacterium]|nr:beta-N-acetylhexosaminidase [Fimbriimonadaceae bacterium]
MALLCSLIATVMTQAPIPIVPKPLSVEPGEGSFALSRRVQIAAEAPLNREAKHLQRHLRVALGQEPKLSAGGAIRLRIDQALERLGPEAYTLEVRPDRIFINGASPAGVFYGIQTLRQLLPPDSFGAAYESYDLPAIRVLDKPRFGWRGAHLDVGRHFMPKDFVLRFLDLMALHKLNTFHFHLTEDQGWRVQIEAYPKLTQIGSVRKETMAGHYREGRFDGKPHGGFYTRAELREIVEYAAERHITVVPEIEMPGHALAALAAYPELSCTGGPFEVGTKWGIYEDIFCTGNEDTFKFVETVLSEVLEIFPGKFIHIGGDEAPKARWKACPRCQARIKAEGLKDEHELQSYFIKRVDKFLTAKGRRLIGWDEILEGGLAPGAAVMSWRGEAGGIAAAKAGHDVVMAPNSHTYLDYYQSRDTAKEPVAIGGFTDLRRVYLYEPVPYALSPEEGRHVLGSQGQLWTEYIPTPSHVEYMAYPRLSALAEVVWSSPLQRSYEEFLPRIQVHLQRLKALGVNFRPLDR